MMPLPPTWPNFGHIGGCKAFVPRSDFGAKFGCSVEAACRLCDDCSPEIMPSGMSFPRDNVPQYAGNGVWDSRGISLSSAVGAMLGDPFQFAVSPEFDALRRLFKGDDATTNELVENMQRTWTADEHYCYYDASLNTRETFFAGIHGLTAHYANTHGLTHSLPSQVRQIIEEMMLRSDPADDIHPLDLGWMVHEGVNCYAGHGAIEIDEGILVEDTQECYAACRRRSNCEAIVVDRRNTDRCYLRSAVRQQLCDHDSGTYDLHVYLKSNVPRATLTTLSPTPPSQSPSAHISLEAATCAAVAVMDGLFASRTAKDLWGEILESQRGDVEKSTFFNRLYGHHLYHGEQDPHGVIYTTPHLFVAQGAYGGNETAVYAPGSGFDLHYMAARACPPVSEDRRWCEWRREPTEENIRHDADAGEIVTPSYKAPSEVDGYFVKSWEWCEEHPNDLEGMNKPIDWAFFRARIDANDHVVVLAPGLIPNTYGVDHFSFRAPQRFVAITEQSPPGGYVPTSRGSQWMSLDRSVGTGSDVPVWGVLYRCARSNAESSARPDVGPHPSKERSRLCAAARELRTHASIIDTGLADLIMRLQLPKQIAIDLQALRIAPTDAFVDLSAGVEVKTQTGTAMERDSVCILTVSMLSQMDETLRQWCALDA